MCTPWSYSTISILELNNVTWTNLKLSSIRQLILLEATKRYLSVVYLICSFSCSQKKQDSLSSSHCRDLQGLDADPWKTYLMIVSKYSALQKHYQLPHPYSHTFLTLSFLKNPCWQCRSTKTQAVFTEAEQRRLVPHGSCSCFLIKSGPPCVRAGTTILAWVFPHQQLIKKIPQGLVYMRVWWRYFLNCGSFFPDPGLCQDGIKPVNTVLV